jgi:predicted lipoprotein with Yx(FWY)xxD motif
LLTLSPTIVMLGRYHYARPTRLLAWAIALLTSASFSLSSCHSSESNTPAPNVRMETDATLGPHMVDAQGYSIYYFTRDLSGTNNCTGGCASVWPIFYEPNLIVGDGLNAADFATITTSDGQPQTTYKGWPMYYYAPANASGQFVREKPGQVTGDKIGNVWFTMRPDYSVLLARTNVTNKTTNQVAQKSFLIDSQGRTLYTFGKDQTSPATQPTNCTGGCISTWPVYFDSIVNLPSSLKSTDFGVITRADGPNGTSRQQATYKGLPLYYYTPDAGTRNKVEGDGIGNIWAVAAP